MAKKTIGPFRGTWRFLSNFWMCKIVFDGMNFPSSEHAFQAAKSLDATVRLEIAELETPGHAKRYGRGLVLPTDWEDTKYTMMKKILRSKFTISKELHEKLIATGDRQLVEYNNWHDNEWGDCTCENCKGKIGKNLLGKALMEIREEYSMGMKQEAKDELAKKYFKGEMSSTDFAKKEKEI